MVIRAFGQDSLPFHSKGLRLVYHAGAGRDQWRGPETLTGKRRERCYEAGQGIHAECQHYVNCPGAPMIIDEREGARIMCRFAPLVDLCVTDLSMSLPQGAAKQLATTFAAKHDRCPASYRLQSLLPEQGLARESGRRHDVHR